MTDRPDNPSAFPNDGAFLGQPEAGMTLRDWFAGQALVGFLSGQFKHGRLDNTWDARTCADAAFNIADAMLTARTRTED